MTISGFFDPDLKEQGQEFSLELDRFLDCQMDADRLPKAQEDPSTFLVSGPDFVLGELDFDHFPARSIEVMVISYFRMYFCFSSFGTS